MQHALTVDVEDYFQVSAFANQIDIKDWPNWPLRVEQNTQALLELFEKKKVSATFFVLGWVAERCPELIRSIHKAGHEVASHGMTHQLVYNQKPEVFKEETIRSKKLIEESDNFLDLDNRRFLIMPARRATTKASTQA